MKKYIFLILILTNKIFSNNNTNILDLYKKQLEICDQLKDPKAVQECKNNILLLAAIHNSSLIQQKIENKIETKSQELKKPESNINNPEDYDPTSDVLKSFAGVIACFGKMVISPQDPINVGTSLCGILAGMVNIIATVTKKN